MPSATPCYALAIPLFETSPSPSCGKFFLNPFHFASIRCHPRRLSTFAQQCRSAFFSNASLTTVRPPLLHVEQYYPAVPAAGTGVPDIPAIGKTEEFGNVLSWLEGQRWPLIKARFTRPQHKRRGDQIQCRDRPMTCGATCSGPRSSPAKNRICNATRGLSVTKRG